MAAGQALQAQPDALRRTVVLNGLHHVFGTGGVEAASGRQQGRDPALVRAEQHQQHLSISLPISRSTCSQGAVRAPRRRFITIHQDGASRQKFRRRHSLTRRFMRLRPTAFPKARGVVKPTRAPSPAGLRQQKAAKHDPVTRNPSSYTLRKSADRSSRLAFVKVRRRGGGPEELSDVGVTEGPFVTDSKLLPSSGTPPSQHGAAVLGVHPLRNPCAFARLRLLG